MPEQQTEYKGCNSKGTKSVNAVGFYAILATNSKSHAILQAAFINFQQSGAAACRNKRRGRAKRWS